MILQALKGYYDRVAGYDLETPKFGYGVAPISFALVIRQDGAVVDVNDLRKKLGKRIRPIELVVPKDFEDRTSGDKAPRALWDKIEYVLGSSEDRERAARRCENFKIRHASLFGRSDDAGLKAISAFLDLWTPDGFETLRYSGEMLADSNIVFQLDGERQYVHERPAAKAGWEASLRQADALAVQCLVSEKSGRLARLHPLIKSIARPGDPTPKLVSFDKDTDAFDSFGKKQGENAPVSEEAAFAYTTALNMLLSRGKQQKVQIGDATTVFWADATDANEAEVAESVFSWMNDPKPPEQQDNAATAQLRQEVMERIEQGRPLENPELNLAEGTRFYILGLAPNAARLSVRFWEATTLGALGKAFHQHWQDLRIDGLRSARPPAIWRLLSRTAPARKNQQGVVMYDSKAIPPNLAGEMMRAILTQRAYPHTLRANILMRFRTDREIDGLRVALVKACLVRDMRRTNPGLPKEIYVSLNRDDPDPAYRLGRLFAILEKTQRAAMDGVNATICDRYYGAASSTPQRVFAFLVKNSKNHLATLRKGRGAKWVKKPAATGGWLDRQIGEIYSAFEGTIPSSLTLEAQSRFAIGYYHEKYARRDDVPDDLKTAEPEIADDATAND